MSKQIASRPVESASNPFFTRPEVGTFLTVLSGLAFLFVCMILPLVGKAAVATVHVRQNTLAFTTVLVLTLALAIAATWSKWARSRVDQSPRPYFSLILAGLSALLLLALALGLLKI